MSVGGVGCFIDADSAGALARLWSTLMGGLAIAYGFQAAGLSGLIEKSVWVDNGPAWVLLFNAVLIFAAVSINPILSA